MPTFEKKRIQEINYGTHTFEPDDVLKRKSYDGCFNVCSRCLYTFYNKNSLDIHMQRCKTHSKNVFDIFYEQEFTEEEKYKRIGCAKVNLLKNKQTLAVIGETFIRMKTMYLDLNDYNFYVIIDMDTKDIMGFFSKQIYTDNSLSCLVVFPPFEKEGLGTFLIDLSQQKAISRIKNEDLSNSNKLYVPLGPERPLSQKGVGVYRKYWAYKTLGATNINEIVKKENIGTEDVLLGLEENGFNFKKWKMKGEPKKSKIRRLLNHKLIKFN